MRETYNNFRLDLAAMPPERRRLVIGILIVSGLVLVATLAGGVYFWDLARRFPQAPFAQPSHLYGRATEIAPGVGLGAADVVAELESQGYREVAADDQEDKKDSKDSKDNKDGKDGKDEMKAGGPLPAGTFHRDGDRLSIDLRPYPTPTGAAPGGVLEVTFAGRRVESVRQAGREVPRATLPPPLLASFYDEKLEERRPVTLDQLPKQVERAILAAEDSGFYIHPGVSPTGIARALWVNLRGGETEQGGSTITQQLVKNVYLSSQRTLTRKAKEALIAMMLELRHNKRAILEAYLNEIYWGASGSTNLIGLGAASHAYYGKEPAELTLGEAATLAGMIQAPANYTPVEHPDKARERRDYVLHRMAELGWISKEEERQAVAEPVEAHPQKVMTRPLAPYFAAAARAEAADRFDVDELDGKGYLLFSSLRWQDQKAAEAALDRGLTALDSRRKRRGGPLQGAVISVDPKNGEILAYVGGRDYAASQFDRVSQARRQAGSAFKPVVYAAAFGESVATPVTLLKDSPITVRIGNQSWKPQDYDRGYQGTVTARTALERSLNIPTVRLALRVGLDPVVRLARDLGIGGDLNTVPALALGTFEVSPRELAGAYSAFAQDGLRPEVHGLASVLDPDGEAVVGDDPPAPRRVLSPQVAYLITSALQGVIDRGTAAAARGWGLRGRLAGKTGTTNDRRDNWFAGYSPDRVTVVWVGYDDNRPTRLSGATAALPIWTRFTMAVQPAGGYPDFPRPPGIVEATVDPTTGQLATDYCPYAVTDLFPDWQVPTEPCRRHEPGYSQMLADADPYGQEIDPVDPYTGQPIDDPYRLDTYVDQDGPRPQITNMPPEGQTGLEPEPGSILIRPSRRRPAPLADPASPPPPAASPTPADDGESDAGDVDVTVETPPATPPEPTPPPPGGGP